MGLCFGHYKKSKLTSQSIGFTDIKSHPHSNASIHQQHQQLHQLKLIQQQHQQRNQNGDLNEDSILKGDESSKQSHRNHLISTNSNDEFTLNSSNQPNLLNNRLLKHSMSSNYFERNKI